MAEAGQPKDPATGLTEQLLELGFESDRLKTGTPPRIDGRSLDYSKMEEQPGDEEITGYEAQTALDDSSLRAPFDGWIIKRSVDIGALVGPSVTGFTIADTHFVKAVFGVPDTAMARVKLGQRQTVTTDVFPDAFAGRITAISPAADPNSCVYSVEVTLPNPRNQLKSGMI